MEIAQPALELCARFLVGFDGDRRLEARDLLAEQTEAARGDEVRPDRTRKFERGFFMFVLALAAKGYAHRLVPEGCAPQIGRAKWRERVCQYVSIPVGAVSLKKQTINKTNEKSTP